MDDINFGLGGGRGEDTPLSLSEALHDAAGAGVSWNIPGFPQTPISKSGRTRIKKNKRAVGRRDKTRLRSGAFELRRRGLFLTQLQQVSPRPAAAGGAERRASEEAAAGKLGGAKEGIKLRTAENGLGLAALAGAGGRERGREAEWERHETTRSRAT